MLQYAVVAALEVQRCIDPLCACNQDLTRSGTKSQAHSESFHQSFCLRAHRCEGPEWYSSVVYNFLESFHLVLCSPVVERRLISVLLDDTIVEDGNDVSL